MQGYKFLLYFLYLLEIAKVSGQQKSDTFAIIRLSSDIEIGFTPRFSGFNTYESSPLDTARFHKIQWLRLQAGYEIFKANYLHLVADYFHLKTNLPGHEPEISSLGLGLQYSIKFEEAIVALKPFRIYKKPISIRWYPEISVTYGKMNYVNPSILISGISQTEKYYGYFQYGITFNFYVNRWCNIAILYLQEYFPNLKHQPNNYLPLQSKIVFKL